MPTLLESRHRAEQAFHDEQAADRARTFAADPARLRVNPDEYLAHAPWVGPAFERLGALSGKAALDFGCGHGIAAVVMAKRGAIVTGVDLSPGYVAEARLRAQANGVDATFAVGNGEELPFADASFDVVWGNAILHHLDLARAGAELARVMRSGAVAVFCEPWGGNPLLNLARRYAPYPGKGRTADEKPLTRTDLEPLRAAFPGLSAEGFGLFGMAGRLAPWPGVTRRLDALDAMIRRRPRLKNLSENWCRYVVLTATRS